MLLYFFIIIVNALSVIRLCISLQTNLIIKVLKQNDFIAPIVIKNPHTITLGKGQNESIDRKKSILRFLKILN